MSPLWQKLGEIVVHAAANAVSGPSFVANAIKTATWSVAQGLAQMYKMEIAADFRQLKEDGLRRSKAKTDGEEARARELAAKAVEAENRANLLLRNDRISKAEEQQKLALAAKTDAEAKSTLMKAEAEQAKVRADAYIKLIEAVGKLKEKGGSLAVDPNNLATLLGVPNLHEMADPPPQPQVPLLESQPHKPPGSKKSPKTRKN